MPNSELDDPFDPNTWEADSYEYRIYGDDHARTFVVLDRVDYEWAIRWRWRPKRSGNGSKKTYLCRNVHDQSQGERIQHNLFMHVAIMKRTGIQQPTSEHVLVDHLDGDEFNCKRANLAWVTKLANGRKLKRAKEKIND